MECSYEVVARPAVLASAGLTYRLPGGEVTRVSSLAFLLTTDAGVANRLVRAAIIDGEGVVCFAAVAPAVQAASLAVVYAFAPDVPASGTAALGTMTAPFVGGWLPPNVAVSVTVANAQAGDTITAGRLLVGQYERMEG